MYKHSMCEQLLIFNLILFVIFSIFCVEPALLEEVDDTSHLFEFAEKDVRIGMDEEDLPKENYIESKSENVKNFLKPYEYMRVCYFANWAAKRRSNISRVTPEDVDPFLCTHINYAFAKVGEDLKVKPYEEDDTQGWTGGPGMYHRIHELRKVNKDLKIMLSIGGWTHASKGFNEVVRDDASIDEFVKNALEYLRKYEFDGFDLDWEYPGATDRQAEKGTREGFTKLVRKLRQEFENEAYAKDKPRLLLSAAVGAAKHRIDEGYEVEEICKDFDFINVMSYDFHGSWDGVTGHNSPLYGRKGEPEKDKYWNVNSSIHIWIEKGCPREKLNLGISAYGRSFSMYSEKPSHEMGVKASAAESGQYTMEPGVYAYYEICEILNKNKEIKIYWHPEHDVPYAYKPGLWIGYDNIKSLINKVDYLKRMNLGGVIVWSLDMDDKTGQVCNEGPYPVLNTLKRELLKPNPYTKTSTKSARLITGFPRGFWSKRQPGSNAMTLFCLKNKFTIFKLLFSTFLFVRLTSFVSFNI